MRISLLLLISLFILSCSKVKPLLTGTIYYKNDINDSKKILNNGVTIDVYEEEEFEENKEFNSNPQQKIEYRTTVNKNGNYRVEQIEKGAYIVVLHVNKNDVNVSDTNKIEIKKNKRYKCDFTVILNK